jgi:YD repeat-containing protein
VTLARDARGGITALTYPGGSQWDFGYDAHGRLASVADPLGNTTTATYDVRNRVATLTFPGGLGSATFTWTDAGLLTNAALSDGTQLTYSYDANGRMIAAGSASFVWNDAGELVGSNGITTPRDAAGRIASVTLAPGKTVNYAYDARGLLESVTTWLGGVTTFTYDESGRLVGLARPNGLSTLYEYDDSSRLTRIRELRSALLGDEEHASIAITYVDTDQIRSVKLLPPSSLLPQLGQVQSTFNPAGQVSGNTYDAVGNLLVDGVKTNTFDLAGRLTTHSNGVDTIDIDYDALGFPVSLAGGPPAQFGRNYAAGGVTVVVRNGGGVDQLYVITTPAGGVLETIDAATDTSSYFHFDHTFSTRFLSDSGGNLTDHYAYDPRGVLLGHSGTSTQPFTFFGHYGVQAVPFTSLSFFGTRPFDSETGMFLTPRKRLIADARAANPYGDINLSQLLLDSGAPTSGRIPRFFGTGRDGGPLIADVTRTNLLYPFVSGGSGFDTGLAIHYPTSPAGSRDHSTGLGRDTLSSSRAPLLDVFSTSRLPGFQGYVMAQSGFQPAHGFAFIFDFGARRLAEGYLSLILDRRTTPVESTASLNEPVPNECAVIAKFRKRFPPGKPIPRHPTSQLGVSNASFWIGRGLNPFGDLNGAPVGRRPLSAPNLLGAEPSGLLPSSYSNPFLGLLTEERPSVRESIRRLLRSRP